MRSACETSPWSNGGTVHGVMRPSTARRLSRLPFIPRARLRPREVSIALRERLSSLKSELPPGVRLELDFDFAQNIEVPDDPTTDNYLLLDVLAPDSASPERIVQNLNRCETVLKGIDGVRDTLTLTQPIFEHGSIACVCSRPTGSYSEQTIRLVEALVTTIRSRLNDELPDTLIRLRDLAGHSRFPSCSYPLDIAVVDTENRGYDALHFHGRTPRREAWARWGDY